MSEAHLDSYHQLKFDETASEVKLRQLTVQNVVPHVWRNVVKHSVAFHEIVEHSGSSRVLPEVSGHLATAL